MKPQHVTDNKPTRRVRYRRAFQFLSLCPLLLGIQAAAQTLNGTWTGTYTITEPPPSCPNVGAYSGAMTLVIQSSGSSFSGTGSLTKVPQYSNSCTITGYNTDSATVSGSVSGSQLDGEFTSGVIDGLTFTATITGNQMAGQFTDLTGSFTLTNGSASLEFVTPQNLTTAQLGVSYSAQFQVSGASGTVSYKLSSDSSPPPGLTLGASGLLSGIPSEAGSFGFTVVATEEATGRVVSQVFNLNVASTCDETGPMTITGKQDFGLLRSGDPIQPVTYQVQYGCPNFIWTIPSPFFGLSFSCNGPDPKNATAAFTCTLSGTPIGLTAPSSALFFQPLEVQDSHGVKVKIVLSGEIQAPNPASKLLPAGAITQYTYLNGSKFLFDEFVAGTSGGLGPYTCTPVPNQPSVAGLSILKVGAGCAVYGQPTATGTYTFYGQVSDTTNNPPVTVPVTVVVLAAGTPVPSNQDSASPLPAEFGALATATPSINVGGVVDAAAYQPVLTPGGIMSIFGQNLADKIYQPSSTPLPTALGNVQVTVNGKAAALFYVSPTQINFQAPVTALTYYPLTTTCLQTPLDPATFAPDNCPSPGAASVVVIRSGVASGTAGVAVSTSAAAVFTQSGEPAGIATHANGQLITASSPAQAGETIVIYGSGIGYPTCSVATGFVSGSTCLVNVVPQITFPDYPDFNDSAVLQYAGLTPGSVGLAQFNLQLPSSLPDVSGVIRLRIGDPTTGQTFNLYVQGMSGSNSATFSGQVVTTQAPATTGCTVPTAATSFLTSSGTVYLFFFANVTSNDSLTDDWLAPDGSSLYHGSWLPVSGNYCFTGAQLAIGNLTASQLGSWQARVFDNGRLLLSVPFTVKASN